MYELLAMHGWLPYHAGEKFDSKKGYEGREEVW